MALASEDLEDMIDGLGIAGTAAEALTDALSHVGPAATSAATAATAAGQAAKGAAEGLAAAGAAAEVAGAKLDAAGRIRGADGRFLKMGTEAHAAAAAALGLGEAQQQAGAAATSAGAKTETAGEQAAKTTESLTHLADAGGDTALSLDDLKSSAAELGAEYAAAIAIVTAYATALYTLADAAVRLTQEKQALSATFDVFTGGAGDDLIATLEDLSGELPFTADRLNEWAKSMASAVGTGEELKDAIRAVAASEAIMGKSGAAATEGLIKRFALMAETGQKVKLDRRILTQLAEAGVSVKALAAALGVAPEKLGEMSLAADDLSRAMQKALVTNGAKSLALMGNTWGSISAKLTEGWEDAFEDLGEIVNPFMAQLRSLASEFFAGSAASKGLSGAVRSVLTPAFEIATRTIRAAHIAYLNMLIAYLQARIFFAPLIDALNKIGVSGGVVNVAMYLIAGAAIVLAVVLGALALAVFLLALPFILAAVAIYGVVQAVKKLIALVSGAVASMDSIKGKAQEMSDGIAASVSSMLSRTATSLAQFPLTAATAGANFVLGLVQAITSGQGPVADAVKALAKSAIGAITGAFQTRSPSRVTARIGGYFTQGLAGGIDDGTDDVQDAAQGAGDAAIGGVGRGMKKAGGKSGKRERGEGTFSPTFNNCTFGSVAREEFEEWMQAWWEKESASGPEPEPAT